MAKAIVVSFTACGFVQSLLVTLGFRRLQEASSK